MFMMSTVPPDGNRVEVPAELLVPTKFLQYDQSGKLIGNVSESEYFFLARLAKGERVVRFDQEAKAETHYVDLSGDEPVARPRPELDKGFDKTEVAVRKPVTLADLPPATVTFEGPIKGRHEHEGGDLVLGWTVPGTYTVKVEAFPFITAEFTLTVGASS